MRGAGPRILVVEDDPTLSEVICTYLGERGYCCTPAFSGTEARLLVGDGSRPVPFELVITDLMLPGLSGEDLVTLVRARGNTPVVVISARATVGDRVTLLRIGADDYLTKPFDLEELLARVEACLRRSGVLSGDGAPVVVGERAPMEPGIVRFGLWEANEESRSFKVAGEPLRLTRTEFDILCALMRRPRKVFSKRELFERVRHEDALLDCADDKTIATHVGNIRAKLKPTGTQEYIQTVWGIGFKLSE